MPRIVGIDEAGYGPNLGPFVMTAVAVAVPEELAAADLWDVLRAAVRRAGERRDDRLLVADSKVVHAGGDLHGLEVGVRALLGPFPADEAISLTRFLHDCCPEALEHLGRERWFAGTTALPVEVELAALRRAADACAQACTGSRIAGLSVRSVVLCTPHFNDLLDQNGSKGAILSHCLAELLTWEPATNAAAVHYFIDKHGGRNHYAGLLQQAIGDGMVIVEEEGAARSRYRVLGLPRELRFTIEPRADQSHFSVALASMVSKYLRELLMLEFNRFWQTHIPGLKPTAGYPGDADRYYQQIADAAARLNLTRERLWRRK